jgi:hypothetical protein
MAVDMTAVARVLGIKGTYEDMRTGSVLNLPQCIAVVAQGATDAVYSLAKWKATSAAAGAARYGHGSPIHHILRWLLPANGDGVGTIPVYVLPLLADAGGSAAAAVGGIEVSGTQTTAASYRVLVSNVKSREFAFAVNATAATKYRAILDAITAVPEMPAKATYVYDTVTALAGTNTGNGTCTALSAPGQPVPGAWVLKCTSAVAHGGVFNLTNPDGDVVATGLTMTPGTGGATVITSSGLQFTLTDAGTDFAVNDQFTITVPVSEIAVTSKWKGASANKLVLSIEDGDGGTSFTLTQPVGGLVNPTVDSALALIGNQWVTMIVNGLNIEDTTAIGTYATYGEGRYGTLVHQPLIVFTGNTEADSADATVVSAARPTDRINSQLVSPGSDDMPWAVAARQVARIAVTANNSPASDYGGQRATGLTPGPDEDQWDYPTRDAAVKAGSSTVEPRDGVVEIGDVVTFYRPTGEEPPADRYVCDIVKHQNVIYNLALKFASPDWVSKPLVPDEQVVTEPDARKPKDAHARVAGLIDALGQAAIISDPATAKKTIVCGIDSGNPKRINVRFKLQWAGNNNITNVEFNYGFYYGAAA